MVHGPAVITRWHHGRVLAVSDLERWTFVRPFKLRRLRLFHSHRKMQPGNDQEPTPGAARDGTRPRAATATARS